MQELFDLIVELESNNLVKYSKYLSTEIPIVQDISAKACQLLIREDGTCNWCSIDWLDERGISVFPVEQDSFGWVIGGIYTSKGIITYG